jgi:hypothetical protein
MKEVEEEFFENGFPSKYQRWEISRAESKNVKDEMKAEDSPRASQPLPIYIRMFKNGSNFNLFILIKESEVDSFQGNFISITI